MHSGNAAGMRPGLWALSRDTSLQPDVFGWAAERLAATPRQSAQWFDDALLAAGAGRMPYPVSEDVAVISARGVLVKSFPVIGWDLASGYEEIAWQVRLAAEDPSARAIALAIDSYGGTVEGLFAATDVIRQARTAKPVGAVVEGAAASAGYALAAASSAILAHPVSSVIGSIGVRALHVGRYRWAAAQGFDVTELAAGARKLDFTPWAPLAPALLERWQVELEEWRDVFIADVIAGRPHLLADDLRATEAAVFERPSGLWTAYDLGLVDALSSDPFAAFVAALDQLSTYQET